MTTEKEYVEGTQIDVNGNEKPILFDSELGVEEGFKVVQIPIYDQKHYSNRGGFMLNEFWTTVWDFAEFVVVLALVLAFVIFIYVLIMWAVGG